MLLYSLEQYNYVKSNLIQRTTFFILTISFTIFYHFNFYLDIQSLNLLLHTLFEVLIHHFLIDLVLIAFFFIMPIMGTAHRRSLNTLNFAFYLDI